MKIRSYAVRFLVASFCLTILAPTISAASAPMFSFRSSTATLDPRVQSGDSFLSPTGEQAISTLRNCLASNDILDVFYLVDASGSLFSVGKQTGTDPDVVRADVIANSLKELASLRSGVTVNYALGFFGTSYKMGIDWRKIPNGQTTEEAAVVAETIRNQPSLGWTNWQLGVNSAQLQLSTQHKATNGCQLLIWLTDGGMNQSNNNDSLDNSAINEMCGAKAIPQAASPGGNGVFNELRQAGVVVIGVLLRVPGRPGEDRDSKYMAYMRPLVEGAGMVDGKELTCGEYPLPEGYAPGALVEANSAGSLARIFADLGAVVGGGFPTPFRSDGSFVVDRGVSSFTIVTTAKEWSLRAPNGETFSAASAGRAQVEETSGVVQIKVKTLEIDVGTWTWQNSSPETDSLFYYGPLELTIDLPETFVAGEDNLLTGRITRNDGRPLRLDEFSFEFSLRASASGTKDVVEVGPNTIDRSTGEFEFHYKGTSASGEIVFEASITNIRTLPSNIQLASVVVSRSISVTLPSEYPTISPLPIKLSDMAGVNGKASGEIHIRPPQNGSAGKVCFPKGAVGTILSDSADREKNFKWKLSLDNKCVEILDNTKTLKLEISNSTVANSEIKAQLEVEYISSDGGKLPGVIPIEFSSTRPVNVAAFGGIALALLVLGILLPFVLLYLVQFFWHKIARGSQLQRAVFDVTISRDGRILDSSGSELRAFDFGTEHFKFLGSEEDSRSVLDRDIGILKAKVPFNPFGRPWFEIRPDAGRVLVGPRDYLPRRLAPGVQSGKVTGFNGDLGSVWALVLSNAELEANRSTGDAFKAKLVVYLRNTSGGRLALRDRMYDVLDDDLSKKAEGLERSKKSAKPMSFQTHSRQKVKVSSASCSTVAPVPDRTIEDNDAPPPPSSYGQRTPSTSETRVPNSRGTNSSDPIPARESEKRNSGNDDVPPLGSSLR